MDEKKMVVSKRSYNFMKYSSRLAGIFSLVTLFIGIENLLLLRIRIFFVFIGLFLILLSLSVYLNSLLRQYQLPMNVDGWYKQKNIGIIDATIKILNKKETYTGAYIGAVGGIWAAIIIQLILFGRVLAFGGLILDLKYSLSYGALITIILTVIYILILEKVFNVNKQKERGKNES